MALPPLQFQRPRRDPSLLAQVFAQAAGGYLDRKLVQEPMQKQRQEHDRSERLWQYHLGLNLQEQKDIRDQAAEEREKARAHSDRLWAYEMGLRGMEGEESFAKAQPVPEALAGLIPGLAEQAGVAVPTMPTYRREAEDLADRLSRMGAVRSQLESGSERVVDRSRFLLELAAGAPPLLVKGADGTERLATPDERAAYMVGSTGVGQILQQYGDDPQTQDVTRGALATFQRIGEQNFVPGPAFDPTAFSEMLDKLASPSDPDGVKGSTLSGIAQDLYNLGMLKSDAGQDVPATLMEGRGGMATVITRLQGQDFRHRLGGYLLATQHFPTPEDFERYTQLHPSAVFSPIHKKTMQRVWESRKVARPQPAGGRADSTSTSGRGRGVDAAGGRGRADSAAVVRPSTPAAQELVDSGTSLLPYYESRLREFKASPTPAVSYNARMDQIIEVFNGPHATVYERLGMLDPTTAGLIESRKIGRTQGGLPSLAALKLNMVQALQAAYLEALAGKGQ